MQIGTEEKHSNKNDSHEFLPMTIFESPNSIYYVLNVQNVWFNIFGHHWDPDSFVVDFKLALINAIKSTFPRAAIRGCYFHFGQSLWGKINGIGLAASYRNDGRLRRNFRFLAHSKSVWKG